MYLATASLLTFDDRCHRAGWRSLRQPIGPQGVFPILREAVEIGLGAPDCREERAGMAVRDAALYSRLELDTKESLYQISEHLAAIAEQIVYVVGGTVPWTRPETVWLDEGVAWESGVWKDGEGLRRVVLTTYQTNGALSWFTQGEQAIYGGSLTEIVVVLGSQREGRIHGHWSKGWKHPKSKEVRLADSLGGEFRTWKPVWREDERIGVSEWTDKMQPVMHKALSVVQREPLTTKERKAWKELAKRKIQQMKQEREPDPQITQCFHPGKCPYGPCSV